MYSSSFTISRDVPEHVGRYRIQTFTTKQLSRSRLPRSIDITPDHEKTGHTLFVNKLHIASKRNPTNRGMSAASVATATERASEQRNSSKAIPSHAHVGYATACRQSNNSSSEMRENRPVYPAFEAVSAVETTESILESNNRTCLPPVSYTHLTLPTIYSV